MIRICWVVTMLGACAGMLVVIDLFTRPGVSAPQEGAAAAIACALCVIPYVFTRSMEGLGRTRYRNSPERIVREGLTDPHELLRRRD